MFPWSLHFWGSHFEFWNIALYVRVRIFWGLSRRVYARPMFQLVGPKNPTQPTERDYILHAATIQSAYLICHGVRLLLGPNYKLCRSAHFFLRPLFLVGSHYVEVQMENINGDLEGGRHEDLIILVNWDSSNPFRNRTYRLTRVFFF